MTRILFGLGNPGERYAKTRHNAGWQVLDVLAARHGERFTATRLIHGEVGDITVAGQRVRMIKPASYMNRVGPVYLRACDVFDCDPDDALVLVDDFNLPMGRLRFRAEGSAAGHNGLKSVEHALATQAYPRLKLGIGPAPEGARWADYVLRGYNAAQREALPDLLERAADACEHWVSDGLTAAANRFNPA